MIDPHLLSDKDDLNLEMNEQVETLWNLIEKMKEQLEVNHENLTMLMAENHLMASQMNEIKTLKGFY